MKKKIVALLLICSMSVMTLNGCSFFSGKSSESASTEEVKVEDTESGHSSESGKDETVYIIADANGSPEQTIVSTWLKNSSGSNTLSDISTLSDLTKVKGDGSYTEMNDGTIQWDANGDDVYYQGTSSDSLPVEVKITFQLDGKSVSAEELDGASGHLTLSIDYTNNTAHSTTVDGKSWTVYQPYMLISTLMFDNETVSNVEVENGQSVNTGENTMVVGAGMPGLKESLGLDQLVDGDGKTIDDIDVPDHVVIDADVKNFSLSTILTVATGDALENLDLDDVDSIDKLRDSMDELADGMVDLLAGTKDLYDAVWGDLSDGIDDLKDGTQDLYDGVWGDLSDGLDDLKDGVTDLDDGAKDLKSGAKQVRDGASSLYDGSSSLNTGMGSLLSGLKTLSSSAATLDENSDSLVSAGALVVDTLFSSATDQLNEAFKENDINYTVSTITHSNYSSVLGALTKTISGIDVTAQVKEEVTEQVTATVEKQDNIDAITDAVTEEVNKQVTETVTETVKAQVTESVTETVKAQVTAQVTESVRTQVEEQVREQLSESDPDSDVDEDTVNATVEAQMNSDDVKAQIDSAVESQMNSDDVKAQIDSTVESQMNSYDIRSKIDSEVEAQMSSDDIQSKISSNVESQKQALIKQNVATQMASDKVNAIIEEALSSVDELSSTIADLYQVGAFYDGLITYTGGVGKLADAVSSDSDLLSGASELKSGTKSLKSGAKSLSDGTKDLYDGTKDLKAGTKDLKDAVTGDLTDGINSLKYGTKALNDSVKGELYDGIGDLKDGVKDLNEGVIKLDDEGIQKIIDLSEKDLEAVYDRLEAVKDYSDEMTAFGGSMPGVDVTTKYVFRTAAIGD